MADLEIFLKLSTPLFAGSWEPNMVDVEFPLRPQTVKGWWRWWARAYAAGALFDMGFLSEVSKQTLDEISRIVGREAGLGYVDPCGRDSEVSSYLINIIPLTNIQPNTISFRGEKPTLQRITLLTRTKSAKEIQYVDRAEFKMEISLRKKMEKARLKAGIGTLLTALILSGFGKGGRRGLGCVDILEFKMKDGIFIEQFEQANASDVNFVKKLVNETKNAYRTLAERVCNRSPSSLPLVPPLQSISARKIEKSDIRVFQIYSLDSKEILNNLQNLHNFFVSARRKKVFSGKDPFREEYFGWTLGLPRKQKWSPKKNNEHIDYQKSLPKEEKWTGYIVKDVERRASPFILAVHQQRAYLSLFISRDWPTEIEWVGGGNKSLTITIDEKLVIRAFSKAKSTFENYCRRTNTMFEVIWP